MSPPLMAGDDTVDGGDDQSLSVDSSILFRYISGGAADAEVERVRQWAAASPQNGAELAELRRAWAVAGEPAETGDVTGVWARIAAAMRRPPGRQRSRPMGADRWVLRSEDGHYSDGPPISELRLLPVSRGRRAPGERFPARVVVAVAVLALAGAGVLAVARARGPHPVVASRVATHDVAAGRGERAELKLADGSQIVLGPASVVRVPDTYGVAERALYLDGEAYFRVVHDSLHPFIVRARKSDVRDLGTAFDVRAYADEPTVRIAVTRGQVAVRPAGPRGGARHPDVALHAGDVGTVDSAGSGRVQVRHVGNADSYTDWTRGFLRLDDIALGEAVPQIERQYDLRIRLNGLTLARRHITAAFTEDNVDDMMRGVAFLLDARYERSGRLVTLTSRAHGR